MTVLAVRLSDKVVFVPEKLNIIIIYQMLLLSEGVILKSSQICVFADTGSLVKRACGDMCKITLLLTRFCNTLKLRYPVSGAKSIFSFIRKQMNTNLLMFYCFGCCMYRSCMEMKCPVSGAKKLMLFNHF